MSRNGAGVYTLPASYLAEPGDTILADQHNSPLEDLQTDANTPRPIVAGGTGASSAVSARTNLSVMSVADIQSGYVPKVATKAALSALDTASFKAAVLTETTREKLWMWKSGDFSAEEAADTDNVNYIPADGVSTSLGCWVAATGDGVTVRTIASGGTGADNAADARTNLGLAIGADVQAHSAVLDATTASFTTAQETKLSGIETGADVTDATNVNAAGAVMNTDTATTDMQFVGTGSDLSIDPAKLLKRGDALANVTAATKADAEALTPDSAPDFIRTAGYASAGDGGGALYKKVAAEPTHEGKLSITLSDGVTVVWYELAAGKGVNVKWLGAVGDGATNDTTAILNAFAFAKSNLASGLYTGRTVFLPRGNYVVSKNAFDITDTLGLHLKGEGARLNAYYKRGATTVTVDGTGSVSGDYMFQFNANNSRNFVAEDISFEYKNSFAGDLFRGSSPGMHFNRCSFFGEELGGARPMTCENLVHFWEGHHYTFHACSFADAQTHIFIDNATAPNTYQWSFTGCSFYDTTGTWIKDTGSSAYGISITGCNFDPIQNNPTAGLQLASQGFNVSGNAFVGSSLDDGPTDCWINVVGGNGVIAGNMFLSNVAGSWALKIGDASVDLRGNSIYCTGSILLTGAAHLTGGNNRHVYQGVATTDIAISDARNLSSFIDYGPDKFGLGYKNSYSIGGEEDIAGVIRYNATMDQSTDGPVYTSSAANRGAVRLESDARITRSLEAARQLALKDAGRTFSQAGTWTLPEAANSFAGMEIAFYKSTSNTGIVINAGSGTNIFLAGANNPSITNGTAEFGYIRFRCIDGTVWMVVEMAGTWA